MSKSFAKIQRSTQSCRRTRKFSNWPKDSSSRKGRFGIAKAASYSSAIQTTTRFTNIRRREKRLRRRGYCGVRSAGLEWFDVRSGRSPDGEPARKSARGAARARWPAHRDREQI